MFQILKKDSYSKARTGILKTAHGEVLTPAYTMVGTHGAIKALAPEDISSTKTQLVISNTYHLWRGLGENIDNFPGLHKYMGWNGTIMTDSGGFQVFSLGFAREHGVSKIANIFPRERPRDRRSAKGRLAGSWIEFFYSLFSRKEKGGSGEGMRGAKEDNLVRITDEGVYFKDEHGEHFLDAKLSMNLQERLGADIILAFDECTSPLNDYDYTKQALERTHEWAKICLGLKKRADQMLYGIVQGGEYEDLRIESAKFIGSLPFDGFAIGGSLGKSREDMFRVIDWVIPYLPEEKSRHLLGIGKIEDVFDAVERGVDTFDCVIPTREARHAALWTKAGRFQVTKGKYKEDGSLIEKTCKCPTCETGVTKARLYEMFKSNDSEAARLATMHNVYFFNNLMEEIRTAIYQGGLKKSRAEYRNLIKPL